MIPYYIQKWGEAADSNNNRKSALCPVCGREELISKDNELGKCSICVQREKVADKPTVSGTDIKELRSKLGLSVSAVADELKISNSVLFMIEAGKRQVNSSLLKWYQLNEQKQGLNPTQSQDI